MFSRLYKRSIKTSPISTLSMTSTDTTSPYVRLPYPGERRFIPSTEIVRLEGSGNYTMIYFRDGTRLLVSFTLKRMLERLPDGPFLRPHRKHIVNRSFVQRFEDGSLTLQTGESVSVARRKLNIIRKQMNVTALLTAQANG